MENGKSFKFKESKIMGKVAKIFLIIDKVFEVGIGSDRDHYFYIKLFCFGIFINKDAGDKWFVFYNKLGIK